jgi:hypothetical protein
MNHAIYKVTSFEIVGPYTLTIRFGDGVSRTIDFRPVLAGPMYGALIDLNQFIKVKIDPEVHTLVWPNGADFDPETLHDWPDNIAAFYAMTHATECGRLRCAEDWGSYLEGRSEEK